MQEDKKLNSEYWNNRYIEDKTGWDIGYHNKIHTDYVQEHYNKDTRILEPGAGSAYEVAYLYDKGYINVHALDYAPQVKERFVSAHPLFPANQYLLGDFFKLEQTFDLVLEQTFFCAIDPSLRSAYVEKMHSILNPGGKIYGVLFNFDKPEGPPYGGTETEYRNLFDSKFEILQMKSAMNSIPQRQGNELIIELLKK